MKIFKRNQETDIHGRPINKNHKKKNEPKSIPENKTITNILTPVKIKFGRNQSNIGDNIARCYAIMRYPQLVDYGWLKYLMSVHGTVSTIYFEPMDKSSALGILNNDIKNYRIDIGSYQKDPLKRQQAEQIVSDAEKTMKRIDQNNEVVGAMRMMIMPLAEDEREFEKICKNVNSAAMMINSRVKNMSMFQKEATQFVWPMYVEKNITHRQTVRMVPIQAFFAGFPFSSTGHKDPKGIFLGYDPSGAIMTLNIWHRTGTRTNSNCVFIGDSGQGKSTDMKNLMLMEYMKGRKVFVIDPQGEYKEMTEKLEGEWIDASGNSTSGKVINPLEILKIPASDNDDNRLDDLQRHIKKVEVFCRLYIPEITQKQISLLKESLEEIYKAYNITWDTDISQLKHTDFPVFKDLYDHLLKCAETSREQNDPVRHNDYRDLALLFRSIAIGDDSFLWGKHTTLETSGDFVCIDTTALNNAPANIKAAQYFLLQGYTWERASRNREERCIIVYDEAHMIINKRVQEALVMLSESMRLARKYEVSIWVTSQKISDFLDPEIKHLGQVVLETPTYKFFHGMNGKGLSELSELYNLKDTEREVIEVGQRGHIVLFMGSEHYELTIKIETYKDYYFGKAGGR